MKTLFSLIIAIGIAATASIQAATPAVGQKAPAFEGKDQDGKTHKLADYLGKKNVILYFYPKDNTPGCTKQACALRDRLGDLNKGGVEVLGVSMDTADSHKKFIADHNLNFPLLSDVDGKLAAQFSTQMEGKKMSRRVSFLINKEGKIVHVTDVPPADIHLKEMQEAVAKLGK